MSTLGDHTFICPECDASIRVDGAMRAALLTNGCVICGATVTPTRFERRPPTV